MLRLICVLIFLLLASTARPQEISEHASAGQKTYAARGVVVAVTPAEKTVTIKHEAIPGYMGGMIMPFTVQDTNELAGLSPGDTITFRLVTETNNAWVDQIRQTGAKTNLTSIIPPPASAPRDIKALDVGDPLPNFQFTNELGQLINTDQYKGQALAITFLFTRCPYPTFCPRMANNFDETQNKLLALTNAPANWRLLTLTFDPDFDTPAVLEKYARAHGADPARWTFATGSLADITEFGGQFGLAFWKDQGGIISHNLRTIVIDASGHVQKIFNGNDWTPEDIVPEIIKAAQVRH